MGGKGSCIPWIFVIKMFLIVDFLSLLYSHHFQSNLLESNAKGLSNLCWRRFCTLVLVSEWWSPIIVGVMGFRTSNLGDGRLLRTWFGLVCLKVVFWEIGLSQRWNLSVQSWIFLIITFIFINLIHRFFNIILFPSFPHPYSQSFISY